MTSHAWPVLVVYSAVLLLLLLALPMGRYIARVMERRLKFGRRTEVQAATLRGMKEDTVAKKLTEPRHGARWFAALGSELRKGDVVLVTADDVIPADGEVIEGVASVDESAITGVSAPVIRESGGDFSAVTGGTRVLSNWIVVRITVNPGET